VRESNPPLTEYTGNISLFICTSIYSTV
jgi:hypothetical protein